MMGDIGRRQPKATPLKVNPARLHTTTILITQKAVRRFRVAVDERSIRVVASRTQPRARLVFSRLLVKRMRSRRLLRLT